MADGEMLKVTNWHFIPLLPSQGGELLEFFYYLRTHKKKEP